jgi:hypothetical protein
MRNSHAYQAGFLPLYGQLSLRRLGRRADAVAASLECRKHFDRLPAVNWRFFQGLLDYNCDPISADEFLRRVAANRLQLCHAKYNIGLTKLAEGDCPAAREHFRKAIATQLFPVGGYQMSRIFLARMDQDPAWPPWIPAKP